MTHKSMKDASMSENALAQWGAGRFGYVKAWTVQDARKLFPDLGDVPEHQALFVLHNADGTPILLTDERATALQTAMKHDLAIVPLN